MASATPRRGKFLSPPSSTPPAAPETPSVRAKYLEKTTASSTPPSAQGSSRGKFLGKPAASPSTLQGVASCGSNAGDAETDARDQLSVHIRNAKIAAVSRHKSIAAERDRVFQDLEEAENIVLSLLECASEVSGALSDMTTAKSKKRHGEKGDDEEENTEYSFKDLTAKVRCNGLGYLAGVKKLHQLLAPHASLVKSYKNHGEVSSEGEKQPHANLAPANSVSSKIVAEATSNMYAARVKKRLAMERCEILREMIRFEELERGTT